MADEAKDGGSELDEHAQAEQEMREFEQADEVPKDPQDWPDGKAKYVTFGGDSDEPYGEGPTSKLGPGQLVRHDDGSVTVDGEEVDDPSEFKGEPIRSGVIEQIEKAKEQSTPPDEDG
jgi:hypothetical protein